MATSITTTYAGKDLREWIRKAFLAANSLSEGYLSINEEVDRPMVIKRIQSSGLIQDDNCDFTPSGDITIDERFLDPKIFKVNYKDCLTPYLRHWDRPDTKGLNKKQFPKAVADGIIGEIIDTVGEHMESMIWTGSTGGGDLIDGLVTKAVADAGIPLGQKITLPALTSANVLAELQKVYEAVLTTKLNPNDVVMAVSRKTAGLFQLANANTGSGQGYLNQGVIDAKPLNFLGVKMVIPNGMPDTAIMAYDPRNSYVGFDSSSDRNEVKVLDQRDIDGSDNFHFVLKSDLDVNYGWSEEVVISEATL